LYLLFIDLLTSRNGEVSKLVRILTSSNNTKVIPQLLLLQIPLGQVLELPLGELNVRWSSDSELGTVTNNGNSARGEVGCLSIYLDAVLEVLLEGSYVEYLIVDWGSAVNDEFYRSFLCLDLKYDVI